MEHLDAKHTPWTSHGQAHALDELLVLQSNGNFHHCRPGSPAPLRPFVFKSACQYGSFAVSEAVSKNNNGLFVVNDAGTIAETWLHRHGLQYKRLGSLRGKERLQSSSCSSEDRSEKS